MLRYTRMRVYLSPNSIMHTMTVKNNKDNFKEILKKSKIFKAKGYIFIKYLILFNTNKYTLYNYNNLNINNILSLLKRFIKFKDYNKYKLFVKSKLKTLNNILIIGVRLNNLTIYRYLKYKIAKKLY